jgi:hypothetical protein
MNEKPKPSSSELPFRNCSGDPEHDSNLLTSIKKTTMLGGLFDGECPYGDSNSAQGENSHVKITLLNDNSHQ